MKKWNDLTRNVMAVYFDYKISTPSEDAKFGVISLHDNFPLLAVSSWNKTVEKGLVCLYLDEVGFLLVFVVLINLLIWFVLLYFR